MGVQQLIEGPKVERVLFDCYSGVLLAEGIRKQQYLSSSSLVFRGTAFCDASKACVRL